MQVNSQSIDLKRVMVFLWSPQRIFCWHFLGFNIEHISHICLWSFDLHLKNLWRWSALSLTKSSFEIGPSHPHLCCLLLVELSILLSLSLSIFPIPLQFFFLLSQCLFSLEFLFQLMLFSASESGLPISFLLLSLFLDGSQALPFLLFLDPPLFSYAIPLPQIC